MVVCGRLWLLTEDGTVQRSHNGAMTVDSNPQVEELTLDCKLPEDNVDLGATSVSESGEGDLEASEIKRVTWVTQTKPELEMDKKSRLRLATLDWDNRTKGDDLQGICSPRRKPQDGDIDDRSRINGSLLATMSPTRCSTLGMPMSPRSSSVEYARMQEKNRILEATLAKTAAENEVLKREHEDEKNDLLDKIECLELANEQLLAGGENSGMEQLHMELTRLQKQNAVLAQRERELQFQLSTKDMLQKEVQHLQELHEHLLDTRLPADTDSESGSKMLQRIVTLETELADAMEVNNLYKFQLQTAFAAEDDVHGAHQNSGPADEEVTKLQEKIKEQDSEIQDLRDRFFVMSIRFAETEAQHEEALMKVRRLQNPLRHMGSLGGTSFKWWWLIAT